MLKFSGTALKIFGHVLEYDRILRTVDDVVNFERRQ